MAHCLLGLSKRTGLCTPYRRLGSQNGNRRFLLPYASVFESSALPYRALLSVRVCVFRRVDCFAKVLFAVSNEPAIIARDREQAVFAMVRKRVLTPTILTSIHGSSLSFGRSELAPINLNRTRKRGLLVRYAMNGNEHRGAPVPAGPVASKAV